MVYSPHTAKLPLQILLYSYREKYAFSLVHCIGHNVQHGMRVIMVVLVFM